MEKDFYKKIKNTFDNPPEYPYEEGQWEKMKEKLHSELPPSPPPPNGNGGQWKKYGWLLLWILPFFLLGGYTWQQSKASNDKIGQLETALQVEINKNNIYQSDTTFNHIVINQYDTIYHTATVYRQINKQDKTPYNSAFKANVLTTTLASIGNPQESIAFNDNNKGSLFTTTSLTPSKITSLGTIQQLLYGDKVPEETLIYNEEALKQALTAIDGLNVDALEIPLREVDFFRYFEPHAPVYREEVSPLVFLQPTGFNVGVEGSILKLIHMEGNNQKGFTVGLTTEINFGKNVSLFLGGEYIDLHYELDEDADISAYPLIEPDNNLDAFHYLRVESKYLQIPFGFKYRFMPDRGFRPYLGMGAIARKPIRTDLNYEFLSNRSEYYITRNYTGQTFSINTFRGEVGFEYSLSKKWNFYLEGTYDHDFRLSEQDFNEIKYFNIKTGILYNF